MNTWILRLAIPALILGVLPVSAAVTRYVDVKSTSPQPPYTNWATAATVIQEAVDAADAGDELLVAPGIYSTGGRAVHGTMTNRVALDKAITLRSVNGPETTIISGAAASGGNSGDAAIRCVLLVSNAVLSGFTLTNGHTRTSGDAATEGSGGGAWCEPGAMIRNAIIRGNSCSGNGGGVYGGTLVNCEIAYNSASHGGGAYGALLYNCTVVSNRVTSRALGAGTARCTNHNSIVHFNYYTFLANHSESAFFWSCTTPAPAGGAGNLTNSPGFVDLEAGVFRLQCGSPCIDAGTNLSASIADDLRGGPRPIDGNGDGLTLFDMGAHERNPAYDAQDIGIRAGFTNFALYFPASFVAQIDGCTTNFWWDFSDGYIISNRYEVEYGWTNPGTYPVILTAQFSLSGATATATAVVEVVEATCYVDVGNPSPAYPFASWATAATNIQDAVHVGSALGRLVLVTNGVYRHGGMAVHGIMTNRVALTNGVRLQSVNGPEYTRIVGGSAPGGGNGDGAVRGLYVDRHSFVNGFTITGGHTLKNVNVTARELYDGGGVWCESQALVTNCVIAANFAHHEGGGVASHHSDSGGRLYSCTLKENVAYEGGGAAYTTLFNCLILSNRLYTADGGGGATWSTLYNCTVVGNSAGVEGGVHGGVLYNSIVYDNFPNNHGGNWADFFYCSTTPLPPGPGNITNAPHFLDHASGNFRLSSNSPCINSGNNSFVVADTDLDGNARIEGGTVDMGAYEFQSPESAISYAWLQQYGLATDGSADLADLDNDHSNNWHEWKSWTSPTNRLSVLRMLNPQPQTNGMVVRWESVSGQRYLLHRATNVNAPFSLLQSNLVGQAGSTSFTDSNAIGGTFFYRVGVPESNW